MNQVEVKEESKIEKTSDEMVTIKLCELKRLYSKIYEYQTLIEKYQSEILKQNTSQKIMFE